MTLKRLHFLLLFAMLSAAVCVAQQHAPPAPAPAGEHAAPVPAGPAHAAPAHPPGPASAGGHAEKPFVLFGKWHVPPLLVEIFRWANFLVLFGALLYLMRRPAADFFAARGKAITEGLESGRRASEEASQKVREINRRLASLESEIAAMRAAAAGEGQAEADRLRQAVRAEVQKIFAGSEQEVRALTKAARNELKGYAAGLAVELAEQRIRGRMTPEKQAELLRGYSAEIGGHGRRESAGSGGKEKN